MALITAKGILNWPHLFAPRQQQNGKDYKYEGAILLHESDPKLQEIKTHVENLKAAFPGGWSDSYHCALFDCSVAKPGAKHAPNPALKGYWCVAGKAKEEEKPYISLMDRSPVLDPRMVYSGAEVWSVFDLYSYNVANNGIFCKISCVVVTGETGALGRIDNALTESQIYDLIPGMGAAAPSSPAPTPTPQAAPAPSPQNTTAPAAPAPAPTPKLTSAATTTYDEYIKAGWNDAMLIAQGFMEP